jgi:hypothetical protein
MNRTLGLLAAFGFLAALIVHALTFAPIDLTALFPYVWSLHVGIFVVFFPFVWCARKSLGAGPTTKNLLARFPRWASVAVIVVFVYAIVSFAVFFYLSEGGAPDIRNGQFILHSHGKLIRHLSEDDYHLKKAYELLGFSGHWLMFYLLPALYFLLGRRPDSSVNAGAPAAGNAPLN